MPNRTRSDSPTKVCTLEGCERALRARGLCGSHYNDRYYPNRHDPVAATCVVCGADISRRTDHRRRATCSVECRAVVQNGAAGTARSLYDWASASARRAAAHGAVVVERYDRHEVFERDSWLCRRCGIKCTTPDPYTLTSATVDHVVPFSRGGEHSLANAQTLCLSCNSTKQDRPV